MRKTIAVSALTAIAIASSASVASAQSPSEFSGFYVGAHAGYGEADLSPSIDVEGGLGGIHAGFNYAFGSMLLGIEGDYDWSDVSYGESALGVSVDINANYFASLRGRLGWLVGSSTLLYATAGYGWSEIEGKLSIAGLGSISQTTDVDGAVLGGGVEYKFSRAFSARLEGLHFWADSDDADRADADTNIIRAGISYHLK